MKRKINRIIKLLQSEGFTLEYNANNPLSYWIYESGNLAVMDSLGNYFSFDVHKGSEFNSYTLGAFEIDLSHFGCALESLCCALYGSYKATETNVSLHLTEKAKEVYNEIMK